MKVFISWSGSLSHKVALAFRDWLPSVIQSSEPYVSSEDIDKGARWSTDISQELEGSNYGILCVTSENIDAPWLNFEAGALSKSFEKSRVSPFLFGVKRSDVKGPLLQFQSTIFEKPDVLKLLNGINQASGEDALPEERLAKVYEVWWPQLEEALSNIIEDKPKIHAAPKDAENETGSTAILEELITLVRQQQIMLNNPERLLPAEYLQHILERTNTIPRDHPVWRDLERSFNMLWSVIHSCDNGAMLDSEELKELVVRTQEPIEYLLRRMSMRTGLALRRRSKMQLPLDKPEP
jgi:hypothetical protein